MENTFRCERCGNSVGGSRIFRPRGLNKWLCNDCKNLHQMQVVNDLLNNLRSIAPITEDKIKERKRFFLQGKSPRVTKAALEYVNSLAEGKFPDAGVRGLSQKYRVTEVAIMHRVKEIAEIFGFYRELWKVHPSMRAQIEQYLPEQFSKGPT